MKPQINFVIPLYNEELVFQKLIDRVISVINTSNLSISVILVDDGSSDITPFLMNELSSNDARFTSIFLSRNFGHQRALSAGLFYADCTEAVFILDGDLQDPPELIMEFYQHFQNGYDVIYAVRDRKNENIFKNIAYKIFYRLLKNISYIHIPLDSGDFSLVSKRVVDQINLMPEESRFIRGMRSWVGFKQLGIKYERYKREDGDSKYSIKQLFRLALNGIFNFSEYPVKLITAIGLLTIFVSSSYFIYSLVSRLFFNNVPEGFTALLFVIILFGGVQLFAIGVLGEYILRIFFQVKGRPNFIIKSIIKDRSQKF
jgi:glycosyltransferase involved in cell wall biosynthesis